MEYEFYEVRLSNETKKLVTDYFDKMQQLKEINVSAYGYIALNQAKMFLEAMSNHFTADLNYFRIYSDLNFLVDKQLERVSK